MLKPSVLVAGGGISGLTAAYDLSRRGIDCLVVERERRLGGLISTTCRDGFLMDGGPDAFLAAKPDGRALACELGLEPELVPTNPALRKVYVLYRGELRPMPEGMRLTVPTRVLPLLQSRLFSLPGKLRILAERFVPSRRVEEEQSIETFVTRRFGAEAFARVGEPLLAGIHCGDASRLSMDRLFPRLVELERRYGSVTRGMTRGASPEGSVFLSLRGGMGRMVERLSEAIPDGTIREGEVLRRLEPVPEGYEGELASGERVRSRAAVVALPLRDAESLLAPAFPKVARALGRIPTVSTAVVFHAFAREAVDHPLDGYGLVVPETEPCRLLAVTFVSTKFEGRAPEGTVLLRTFLGGRRDPAVLGLDDERLQALSIEELARALGSLGEPLFSRVVRWRERTPQVELGHGRVVAELDFELESFRGLRVLASGLHGIGIPDSIGYAREAAALIAKILIGE